MNGSIQKVRNARTLPTNYKVYRQVVKAYPSRSTRHIKLNNQIDKAILKATLQNN